MDRYYIDRNEEDSILLIDVTLQNAKGFLSGKGGLWVIFIGGWRVGQQQKARPLDGQLVEVEDAGTNEAANSSLIVLVRMPLENCPSLRYFPAFSVSRRTRTRLSSDQASLHA
jgi:hypothetical protein